MTKAEMVLKVVISPIENVRTFVEQFRKLLPDSDLQDLQRVLEMKVSLFFFFKDIIFVACFANALSHMSLF